MFFLGMADTKGGGMVINTQENSQDRSQATMDPYLAQSMRMHFDQMSSAYNAKVSGNQTTLDSFVGNKTTNKKKFVDSTTKIDDPTVELVPKDETDTIRPKALGPLQQTILPFVKAFHANKAASDSSSSLPTVKKAVTTVSPDDPMVSKVSDSAAVIKTKTTTDQGKLAYPVYNLYPPLPSYTVSNNTVNDSYKFNGGITATAQFAASPYSDFIYDSASQNSNVANNKSHLHTTVGDGYPNPTIVPPVFAKQSVTTSSSGKVLTEEEKQRIAKNREIALERRRLAEQNKAPASNTNQTMPYNASGGYSNGQIMSSSVNHPIVHNVLSSFDQNKSIAEKAPYGYPSVPVNGIVDNVSVNPYVFSTASGGKVQVSAGAIGEGMGVMKSAGKCHSGR